MSDVQVILHGWVGQDVTLKQAGRGEVATLRVGTTPRVPDGKGGFRDGETTWTTVQCWRQLAKNVTSSIHCGDPVVVIGKVRTSKWRTEDGEERQRSVVQATSVSHDLARGTSIFRKTPRQDSRADDDGVVAKAITEAESQTPSIDPSTGEIALPESAEPPSPGAGSTAPETPGPEPVTSSAGTAASRADGERAA